MGQYYTIANVDKKEYLYSHDYNCGLKLMEFSYIVSDGSANDFMSALNYLLDNDWKGDRVYVIGDYANTNESDENDKNWIPVLDKLQTEFNTDCLYEYISKNFKTLKGIPTDYIAKPYLCNNLTQEYINLRSLPVAWDLKDSDEEELRNKYVAIYPLPLLLAMGNNRGGGDYHEDTSFVGSWTDTSKSIFFSDTIPENFEEFRPNFVEK